MKYYVAYGSNLDMMQMKRRCPDAKPYKSGWLIGYELIYRGSKTGSYATVRKADGKYVPVGLWKISREDERCLDRYEGYPVFYQKQTVSVALCDGKTIKAMIYIMRPDAKPGRPSEAYIDTIYRGYHDFSLDYRFLMDSIRLNDLELCSS